MIYDFSRIVYKPQRTFDFPLGAIEKFLIGENMEEKTCLNCGKTDEKVPLLNLSFKGEAKYVCAQCFPTLIHKIYLLAEKLPGVEIPANSAH